MANYLVIGGTSGISAALVDLLVKEQHEVFLISRSATSATLPPQVKAFGADILTDPFPEDFLPDVLDGLVYSPGSITLKSFKSLRVEDFLDDYEVNVAGAVKTLQNSLPALKKSENASVVFFSTVAVGVGMPYHSLVSSSKGALEGLVRALAAEFAPTIRVNAVAPSLTDTPLAQKILSTDEKKAQLSEKHPLKRIGTPDDVAHAVKFLLGAESCWITGQVLSVDGGLSTLRI
ncbi:oxidoreductase (plasmid) [Fulvitalea axinellae]|uniref:Oxidoreductase n=1 Tax=Fulvitalea axinellae TaxID=1182444 RepID=A0AAU9D8E6_9BACT|nr:oxidoreductase [Fulvitalea axinellae]